MIRVTQLQAIAKHAPQHFGMAGFALWQALTHFGMAASPALALNALVCILHAAWIMLRRGTPMLDLLAIAAVAATLGQRPDLVTRLAGGANNVVARVDVGGQPLLAKLYFTHARDPRDRLGTEFGMLDFLWANGVRCVPEGRSKVWGDGARAALWVLTGRDLRGWAAARFGPWLEELQPR